MAKLTKDGVIVPKGGNLTDLIGVIKAKRKRWGVYEVLLTMGQNYTVWAS